MWGANITTHCHSSYIADIEKNANKSYNTVIHYIKEYLNQIGYSINKSKLNDHIKEKNSDKDGKKKIWFDTLTNEISETLKNAEQQNTYGLFKNNILCKKSECNTFDRGLHTPNIRFTTNVKLSDFIEEEKKKYGENNDYFHVGKYSGLVGDTLVDYLNKKDEELKKTTSTKDPAAEKEPAEAAATAKTEEEERPTAPTEGGKKNIGKKRTRKNKKTHTKKHKKSKRQPTKKHRKTRKH